MEYLLDTVAIVRYFTNSKNIGKKALEILNNDENQFYVPVMALIEIMYLAERNRIEITFEETIEQIETRHNCQILNITPQIVLEAKGVEFPELHDRLILATAKLLDIPVISSDTHFPGVESITAIWN